MQRVSIKLYKKIQNCAEMIVLKSICCEKYIFKTFLFIKTVSYFFYSKLSKNTN